MATTNPKYVVDELLMYTFSKLDNDTPGCVKNVVCPLYGDNNKNNIYLKSNIQCT